VRLASIEVDIKRDCREEKPIEINKKWNRGWPTEYIYCLATRNR
jgi:hypothetical protein